MGIAMLLGIADGILSATRRSLAADHCHSMHAHDTPLGYASSIMLEGVAGVLPGNHAGSKISQDIERFWFARRSCLCMRCGATFNDQEDGAEIDDVQTP